VKIRPVSIAIPVSTPSPVMSPEEQKMNEAIRKEIYAMIIKPFVRNSFVIDDYTMEDRKRTMPAIVQARIAARPDLQAMFKRKGSPSDVVVPQVNDRSVSPDVLHPRPISQNLTRTTLTSSSGSTQTPGKKAVPETLIAPADFVPKTNELHFYIIPKRSLQELGSKCFKCGVSLASKTVKSFYCYYTGQYFCKQCFGQAPSYYIPAKIINEWDFLLYAMNAESYAFLSESFRIPSVDISALRPALYKQVPLLRDARIMRKKLYYLREFMNSCPRLLPTDPVAVSLCTLPGYLIENFDLCSLSDLVDTAGLVDKILALADGCQKHIMACPVCSARGSYCEICRSDDPIYSFQVAEVTQCKQCGGIFHKTCFVKTGFCPKCLRQQKRVILSGGNK